MTAIEQAREFLEARDRIYSKREMTEIVRGLVEEVEKQIGKVEQLKAHAIKYIKPFENSYADEVELMVEDLLVKHGESHSAIQIYPCLLMTIKEAMRTKRYEIHAMKQQAAMQTTGGII